MAFCDKLKENRKNAGVSLEKLATELGVSKRTLVNYENGTTLPPIDVLPKIAKFFGVSLDSLMTEKEELVSQAYEKGGSKEARELDKLLDDVTGLFAGGRYSQDEKDSIISAINDAYWIAREENKRKYTPKKYRKNSQEVK